MARNFLKRSLMLSFVRHLKKAGARFNEALSFLLVVLVGAYRTLGTLYLGGACRFQPSCSEFALEAIQKHAPVIAIKLIFNRLLRCRPGALGGFDPVPSHQKCKCHTYRTGDSYGTT